MMPSFLCPMCTAFLGIGSNVADAIYRISKALELLAGNDCRVLAQSDIYQVSQPYYNLVAKVQTGLSYDDLLNLTKRLESLLGRLPHVKGDKVVPLDIDIVVFDGRTVRESDFNAHYFSVGYDRVVALKP